MVPAAPPLLVPSPQGMLCALSPEYCSSLCSPSPSQSCYLQTIGQELLPGIGVIWTGECQDQLWVCSHVQCLQTPGRATSK